MQIGFAASRDNAPMKRQVSLTPREREIVMLLRQGLRNKQIAAEMSITEGTVRISLVRLFHKMGVRTRVDLASYGGLDNPQFSPARYGNPSARLKVVQALSQLKTWKVVYLVQYAESVPGCPPMLWLALFGPLSEWARYPARKPRS